MNALEKAIAICGSNKALAAKIDEKPATVSAWVRRGKGKAPAENCPDIELAVDHQVTCEELRPDVKWWVLRGNPLPAANDGQHTSQAA